MFFVFRKIILERLACGANIICILSQHLYTVGDHGPAECAQQLTNHNDSDGDDDHAHDDAHDGNDDELAHEVVDSFVFCAIEIYSN